MLLAKLKADGYRTAAGRIEFRPEERDGARGYRLRWSVVPSALMAGNIAWPSPRGFEPRLPP